MCICMFVLVKENLRNIVKEASTILVASLHEGILLFAVSSFCNKFSSFFQTPDL